jgi:hypothetical protein
MEMKPNEMTRKQFVTLTFTLIGVGTAAGACSSTSTNNNDAGTGAGGTGGSAGAGGTGGSAGAGGAGGTGGSAGAGGTGGATACTDPLPEAQDPDTLMHVHSLTVPASTLDSTMDQTFTTGSAGTPAHTHMVTLNAANLATIKGGGTVDVMSTISQSHLHSFKVGCTSV